MFAYSPSEMGIFGLLNSGLPRGLAWLVFCVRFVYLTLFVKAFSDGSLLMLILNQIDGLHTAWMMGVLHPYLLPEFRLSEVW